MSSDREDARRWQQLAEEASAIARKLTDFEAIQIMRSIVLGYEILAKHARIRVLKDENSGWNSD